MKINQGKQSKTISLKTFALKLILMYIMALIYVAAGINHFWHPVTYLRIMPSYLPAPYFLNYAAGVVEISLGILICFKQTQNLAGWSLAVLLTIFFIIHIHMLQQSLNKDAYDLSPAIAWGRLFLQPVLIAWALWYTKNEN